jgi:acetylornithine deacetylase/succinyl-diaminopimelate desuccinylase-like protein
MNASISWPASTQETIDHLCRLVQCETTNPPGNELPAILEIKDILDAAGFPRQDYQILESAPNRVNLIARLRGDGSQRPLLLSGHVDVVPAESDRWSCDPYCGQIKDGYVWGRGALDMKGSLAMYLQVFLLAFRHQLPLKRDLILAAIADEEAGMDHGSKFLVEQHRSLIGAEYGFTEMGAISMYAGNYRLYPIQVAEKSVCWLRMTAQGQPGHGSIPHPDNAVAHLARALERLRRARHLPVHIVPTVRSMITAIARQLPFPASLLPRLAGSRPLVSLLLNVLPPDATPLLTALLSNTATPTMLQAGAKANVIPSSAQATIDCRLLPGQKPEDAMREILAITGKGVVLEPLHTSTGAEFSTDTALYRLLEKSVSKMDRGGITFPFMMAGATDACQYQRAGICMYGFTPGVFPKDFPTLKMAHGHDERFPICAIETGLPVLWEVIRDFCATNP